MSIPLNQLLPQTDSPVLIEGLTLDSRSVQKGYLFFAIPGGRQDGRVHIADALAQGAAAVAYEIENAPDLPASGSVPLIPVRGLAGQLSAIAGRFHGNPSHKLRLVGVTGTNGKTSVTQLIAQACDRLGQRCGIVGTLGTGFYSALQSGSHTTPDALSVQATLSHLERLGAQSVAMEVSSHGLDQGRVAAVNFEVAVFTNLSRDHLDYHGTMEAYAQAKSALFKWPGLKTRVINIDDELGARLASEPQPSTLITYSLDNPAATLYCRQAVFSDEGIRAGLATPAGDKVMNSPLIGRFNLSNLLATVAALLGMGYPLDDILHVVPHLQGPAGRMQRLGGGKVPLVIVDYAHTPDALEKVLLALRPHTQGQLICLFGCGGDRDSGKRPLMARIAERLADIVVVTDDNPRTEPSERIIADIRAGFVMPEKAIFISARDAAIAYAINMATPQDVVLLAGKGHEDYQEVSGVRMPFSDLKHARQGLAIKEADHA
ncbi:UDP-N-acetylmuramoylalanyl-D-glutamate--2,6-diaminopimelate ligase [Pseudomonas duriflava]|uniref:UDP-N-acetylmuramoyl-L-alanyl-D-glutamate--2,6-diaminopimelate ligase n=1 Tax=Pseudomonas duriflava TaxID=459528 RepID=A0A562QQJ3_9PSED|nr:UDP-N-acetylmuramoyl-L-alanyl-D-glutamate--2,6-diaminopimelate ligase [Pseudomonas duriflava]TWI58470.1 UDP-N-acetylmuramoylalanyl-D-glutamate--2,6-diaminopimelate ligase [Pseudomonas duriflava]